MTLIHKNSFSIIANGTSFSKGRRSRELWNRIEEEKQKINEDFWELSSNTNKLVFNDNNNKCESIESYKSTKIKDLDQTLAVENSRNSLGIVVVGDKFTNPCKSFEDIMKYGVPSWIIDNIRDILKYKKPTPIQAQVIPLILSGSDILAQSPTGSGKTLSYLLPILGKLTNESTYCKSLILSPTRELAQQIVREVKVLLNTRAKKYRCRYICGKVKKEQESRTKRLDIAVSTPFRFAEICKSGIMNLKECSFIVLDEVDKLLDMGFSPQIDEIIAHSNVTSGGKVQIVAFSATLPNNVKELAESIMKYPIEVTVGHRLAASKTIKQELICVTKESGKLESFRQLIKQGRINLPVLLFTNSKENAQKLFSKIVFDNLLVDMIHSDMAKIKRDNIVKKFRTGQIWVLICTDLIARGVDFKNVATVINYDFPQTSAIYIHRIGRSGRAGRFGHALTFFTLNDLPKLKYIAKVMKSSGIDVPNWILKNKIKNTKKGNIKKKKD
ncbi:DEAD DEAH box helicase family protein [Cryptosporidium andersoni]|uniref:RNA helicase n=1 Tax=Cryptosporidium andersoni TaxID=117008 RepID=A0A1J4MUJ7_9CRYT|nr:DEAD DEAH box helicase family protein [Cryptosporidium andersoni]